ncbi:MAG: Fic/DOC family N-terminal domain-containing protein [Desulfonauticus sp.]|nr:Fic/DOC family N-terminal domain-containing protein [Desulfonauticus sp.]
MRKKSFIPHELPPNGIVWENLISLIGEANRKIAKYDALLSGLINPNVLLSPLTTNEAVISSRIEGTQASILLP